MEKAKLKFTIENLGKIKHAEIELNKITTIIGQNSTSKTYLNYLIYGFISFLRNDELSSLISLRYLLPESLLQLKNAGEIEDKVYNDFIAKIYKNVINLIFNLQKQIYNNLKHTNTFIINYASLIKAMPQLVNCIAQEYSRTYGATEIGYYALSNDVKLETTFDYYSFYDWDGNNTLANKSIEYKKLKSSYDIEFTNLRVNSEISDETLNKLVNRVIIDLLVDYFKYILPNPVILCSERAAISVFSNKINDLSGTTQDMEISIDRTSGSFKIKREFITKKEDQKNNNGLYQQAMLDNITMYDESLSYEGISFLSDIPEIYNYISENINTGKYKSVKNGNDYKLVYDIDEESRLEINATSSSIKSLYMLDAYIKKLAKPNDLLIIDEPELNLHPSNQRKVARLLAMLANNGIQVMFTTHSDYIMNEINNLLLFNLLDADDKNEVSKKYNLLSNAGLKIDDISPYVVANSKNIFTLEKCKKSGNTFEYDIFDDEMIKSVNLNDELRNLI